MTEQIGRRDAINVLGASTGLGILSLVSGYAAVRTEQFPKRAIIRTLLKDLPPSAMGTGAILFHEHVGQAVTTDLDRMIERVKAARRDGVVCIVDGGHPDMGRKLDSLKQIAIRTSMHIVAGGGYYRQNTYPPEITAKTEDQIADDLVREANRDRLGAFGEIGQSTDTEEPTADERKVFRAIGKAHLRTNLPIFTHNPYGIGAKAPKEAGLRQLDVLESAGVKPQRVAVGHVCCLDDPSGAVIKQIAERGAFVGFDRVTGGFLPDDKKVNMILALLDAGYADKLLLSSDFTGRETPAAPPGYVRPLSLGSTLKAFIPKLRQAGVKEVTLHAITVNNPRRFLAFLPKEA